MTFSFPDDGAIALFAFAYLPRSPRDRKDLMNFPQMRQQLLRLVRFQHEHPGNRNLLRWCHFTNRNKPFFRHQAFRQAVQWCREENAVLVLADALDFIRKAPARFHADCWRELDSMDVEVFDLGMSCRWSDIDPTKKQVLFKEYVRAAARRSGAIKEGLQKARKPRREPADNHLKATRQVVRRADARAERLRPFVESWQAGQPQNKRSSPSALARALNDAGKPSVSGKPWTPPSAKNLLKRLFPDQEA